MKELFLSEIVRVLAEGRSSHQLSHIFM